MKSIKIAVVTTPYEVSIYASATGDFHLIKSVGKDSFQKRKEVINTLTQAYMSIGFDVQVKMVIATDSTRKPVREALRKVLLNNEPPTIIEQAKQNYINAVCGGAFGS
jgi:hypothetical protein